MAVSMFLKWGSATIKIRLSQKRFHQQCNMQQEDLLAHFPLNCLTRWEQFQIRYFTNFLSSRDFETLQVWVVSKTNINFIFGQKYGVSAKFIIVRVMGLLGSHWTFVSPMVLFYVVLSESLITPPYHIW